MSNIKPLFWKPQYGFLETTINPITQITLPVYGDSYFLDEVTQKTTKHCKQLGSIFFKIFSSTGPAIRLPNISRILKVTDLEVEPCLVECLTKEGDKFYQLVDGNKSTRVNITIPN